MENGSLFIVVIAISVILALVYVAVAAFFIGKLLKAPPVRIISWQCFAWILGVILCFPGFLATVIIGGLNQALQKGTDFVQKLYDKGKTQTQVAS